MENALPQARGKGIEPVRNAVMKPPLPAVQTDKQHPHSVKAQEARRSPFPGNAELSQPAPLPLPEPAGQPEGPGAGSGTGARTPRDPG